MPKRRAVESPSPSPPPRRQRSSSSTSESSEDDTFGTHDQKVRKLVRLALVSEYTRQPLRRADISLKVLEKSRSFKPIFEAAQKELHDVFGMTMTELPLKDKVTISQKRAAQKSQQATSSKAYILTSTLPQSMRIPTILAPPKIPSQAAESSYTGFYTFIVSVILLSNGQRISEGKLNKYLQKCNAEEYCCGDKTEKTLKRMEKEGYIIKIRERDPGGEENVDYIVGPRGKVEVGERGAAAFVKNVYGKRDLEMDELENKLEKSLGAGTFKRRTQPEPTGDAENEVSDESSEESQGSRPLRGRNETTPATRQQGRRSRAVEDEADEDEEDEEEEPTFARTRRRSSRRV